MGNGSSITNDEVNRLQNETKRLILIRFYINNIFSFSYTHQESS